jgi:hypothetical protein
MHTHTHMHMHMHTRMHITYANAYHICISHMHMHITYAHAYNICTCLSHTHVCTPTASMALARLLDGLLLPGENLGAVGIPFVDHVLHRGWRARLRVWVGGAALGVAIACTSVRASFFPTCYSLLPTPYPRTSYARLTTYLRLGLGHTPVLGQAMRGLAIGDGEVEHLE